MLDEAIMVQIIIIIAKLTLYARLAERQRATVCQVVAVPGWTGSLPFKFLPLLLTNHALYNFEAVSAVERKLRG
jgi:hypothetical protein